MLSSSEGFEEYNEPAYLTSKKPYGHLERETEDKLFSGLYGLVAYFAEDPYGDIRILIATVRFYAINRICEAESETVV